jgi:predicted ATPase with chaperone activity
MTQLQLSAAVICVLKLARTIADLAGCDSFNPSTWQGAQSDQLMLG